MTSYLRPYMDTMRVVTRNLSDLIYVHSMFQLLYDIIRSSICTYCAHFFLYYNLHETVASISVSLILKKLY